MFSPDDIQRVRDATDIVTVIGEYAQIKRVGRSWMARCPLHGERTPSLSVSQEKGVYYCFGCGRSGDVITFIREIEKLDFIEAVELLAAKANIDLVRSDPGLDKRYRRRKKLLEAIAEARDFYHEHLLSGTDAGVARQYLRGRGYDREIVTRYRLGFAPNLWDTITERFKLQNKLNTQEMQDTGLVCVRSSRVGYSSRAEQSYSAKRMFDFFRGRILFPITDHRGETVAFGGRLIDERNAPQYRDSSKYRNAPKYINTSSKAFLYDKSKVLYGLYEHREEIIKQGEAVICEGYTDVIGSVMAGVATSVATCGTSLTEDHVRLLKRFSVERVVLAFDADRSGVAAAERVYNWERAYELEFLVADIPHGMDPDDLARESPEALRSAVSEAVPFLQFRINRVLETHHMSTVEDRAKAAGEASEIANEHPDRMVRDPYLMQIADRCQIDIRLLRETANNASSSLIAKQNARGIASRSTASHVKATTLTVEDEAIKLAIHKHEDMLQSSYAALFVDQTKRKIFEVIQTANSVLEASELLDADESSLLHRLAVDPNCAPIVDVLAGMVHIATQKVMVELQAYASDISDRELYQHYMHSLAWLKEKSEMLHSNSTTTATLNELIPWLLEYRGATRAVGV